MGDFDLSPDPAQPSPDAGLPDAVGNMAGYLQERGGRQAKEQAAAAQTNVVHNVTDGTVQVNMPADTFNEYVQGKQKYDQIYSIYENTVKNLEAQRAQIREHPFANTLATIAGSLAANDPNPIARGLGQAAQRLNPTDAELQAREQVPLVGMRETQTAKVGAEREERLAKAQERRLDLADQEQKRRSLADEARERHNEAMEKLSEDRIAASERIAQTREDSAERRQAQRDKTALDVAAIRERTSFGLVQARLDAAAMKAQGKEMEVPKAVPEKLTNLSAAEKSLDNIEGKIKKYSALQGEVAGRTLAPAAEYFNKEASRFFTNLKLEVAQTIKSTGAGARGFGPMERGFFEKLATAKTHSPEENLGVIEAWRDYIRQNRQAYLENYKGLNSAKYKSNFGKDANLISEEGDSGSDPLGIR